MNPNNNHRPPRLISDVIRPGRAKPSDSSRPIIPVKQPKTNDPMFVKPAEYHAAPSGSSVQGPPPIHAQGRQTNHIKSRMPTQMARKQPAQTVEEHTSTDNSLYAHQTRQTDAFSAFDDNEEVPSDNFDNQYQERQFYPEDKPKNKHFALIITLMIVLGLIILAIGCDVALDKGIIKIGGVKAITHLSQLK